MIRFSRTRKQDFRTDGTTTPTGLDYLERINAEENATHDAWVRDLSLGTLKAIWEDLAHRPAWDRKNPEQRWTMGRRAAVGRRLAALGVF
jgi:hypothetical protein